MVKNNVVLSNLFHDINQTDSASRKLVVIHSPLNIALIKNVSVLERLLQFSFSID